MQLGYSSQSGLFIYSYRLVNEHIKELKIFIKKLQLSIALNKQELLQVRFMLLTNGIIL